MDAEEFYEFLRDKTLVELNEQVKISNDILDVITLNENQHSAMLEFCLAPNQGHGQGDAVIRDFLLAAHHAATTNGTVYHTKRFFEEWTPGRICNTSFGSAYVSREMGITIEEGTSKKAGHKGRLDLFLVDHVNKIIVVIEHKVSAKLNATQLERYNASVVENISKRPVFQEYSLAFVALDRDLDDYYDEDDLRSFGTRWCYLGYEWLRSAAIRAKLHLERNNQSAMLLMSYCQRLTRWEPEAERKLSHLAAHIAATHESVVNEIACLTELKLTEWTPSLLLGCRGELNLYYQQNRRLCEELLEVRGIAGLSVRLLAKLPMIDASDIDMRRAVMFFTVPKVFQLMLPEADWPIYVQIKRESHHDDNISRFMVRLTWRSSQFNEEICEPEKLRTHFAQRFPALKRFAGSEFRRVAFKTGLDTDGAVKYAVELAQQIDELLRTAVTENLINDH